MNEGRHLVEKMLSVSGTVLTTRNMLKNNEMKTSSELCVSILTVILIGFIMNKSYKSKFEEHLCQPLQYFHVSISLYIFNTHYTLH